MTNGTPRRVAMRDSITNRVCNNFSMKLPGLRPSACGNATNNVNKALSGVDYLLTSSCDKDKWVYNKGPSKGKPLTYGNPNGPGVFYAAPGIRMR